MKKHEILLREYELHRKELQLRADYRVRGLSMMLVALAAIGAYGIGKGHDEVFIIVPWFLIGAAAFIGHQVMCTVFTIAYLEDLEHRIGYLDFQRILIPRNHSFPAPHKNPWKILHVLIIIPFLIAFVVSLYLSHLWIRSNEASPEWLASTYDVVTVVFLIIVIGISVWGYCSDCHLPERTQQESCDAGIETEQS